MEKLTLTPIGSNIEWSLGEPFQLDVVQTIVPSFTHNTIIFATTQTGEEVVLKHCLYGSTDREWSGLLKTTAHGIRVPIPIALAINSENNAKFVITRRYTGHSLYYFPDPEMNQKFGETIQSMHEIPADSSEWRVSGKPDFSYYDRHLFTWTSRPNTTIDNSKPNNILALLAQNAQEHCSDANPRFTHQDLHDGQAFISDDKQIILTDFETWKEADTLEDIAMYLFHSVRTDRPVEYASAFMNGYCKSTTLQQLDKSTIAFYLLFVARRAIDRFAKHRTDYLEIAKENLSKIISYIDEERIWIDF